MATKTKGRGEKTNKIEGVPKYSLSILLIFKQKDMNKEEIKETVIKSLLSQRENLISMLKEKEDGYAITSTLWEQCTKELETIDEFINDLLK